MYVVCVEFEIVPSQLENFIGAMRKNAAQSFADEVGCRQFDICQDQKNPNSIFLYEIYDDEAAFEVNKNTTNYH